MKLKDTTALTSFKYIWLLKRIFPYIKNVLGRVILGFIVAIPVGLLDGIMALALTPYMDYVLAKKDFVWGGMTILNHTIPGVSISYSALAVGVPFAVISFAVFQGVMKYLNSYLSDWTSLKITNAVKKDLFSSLVYLDTSFFDENTSGIIINRYLSDPDISSKGIVRELKTLVITIFGAGSLIAVMLYSSWKLAIVAVIVLFTAFIPMFLVRKKIKSVSNENMVLSGNITTTMNETYSGNKVVTSYNLQERQKTNFFKNIDESFNVSISLTKRVAWMSPIMYLIASCGIAFVLWFGTKLITSGEMTTGAFASFITSLLLLYKPIKSLGDTLTELQNIFVALGRVFELFDHVPTILDPKNPKEFGQFSNEIAFNNVTFGYNNEVDVLKNINLIVPKGETLAIVGNSGGGKTTLVNLLPRFYDVKAGSITFDDTDIRDFRLSDLRDNIAFVFQDNFLFTGTIRENIMLGNPEASQEDFDRVIEYSHLKEVIESLPDGVDTLLGERGLTLSGGQRQRVAIARAMIKNSDIIVLDEATSALDNESEAIVQAALDNLIHNKTVFVIAHRLSTIKNANRIAVINEGELVELGTHEELMNIENGHYKHLSEMQFKNQEEVCQQ